MIINLTLPDDFKEKIDTVMEDELNIACKKWGVVLNQKERAGVIEHSRKQLRQKVSESAKMHWDYSSVISIKANAPKTVEINLPQNTTTSSKISLVPSREGWEIDRESRDDAVNINEFLDFFIGKIYQWSRTAVNYGVSSYTQ